MGNIIQQTLRKADAQLKEWANECDYKDRAKARFKELHEEDGAKKKARSGPYAM